MKKIPYLIAAAMRGPDSIEPDNQVLKREITARIRAAYYTVKETRGFRNETKMTRYEYQTIMSKRQLVNRHFLSHLQNALDEMPAAKGKKHFGIYFEKLRRNLCG